MLLKSIIIAIWAGLAAIDQFGPHFGFRKPLLAGFVVGIILGDVTQGLIIAGTIELMWLGTNNIGAYQPPDVISGSIVGVAIGILSGGGVGTGVAVAIPVAILVQQLAMLVMTLNIGYVNRADKAIDKGDFKAISRLHYLGGLNFFLSRAIPVFVAVYFGAPAIEAALDFVPEFILDGLTIASGIIPAVGIALLLSMMIKKDMWIFLIIGFTLSTFLDLAIIPIALIGIALGGIYDLITRKTNNTNDDNNKTETEQVEGSYDL